MKSSFIKVMLPLSQLYYKHVDVFYGNWRDRIERVGANLAEEEA